jgi:DNA polymerase-1
MALLPRTAALLTTVTQCRALAQNRARPRYLLIDGHHLLYRSFYGMPQLTRAGGQPVGAVMGVANTLLKLARPYSRVVFCLDPKGPGWREEMCGSYKATRPKMPPELRPQVAEAADVARAFSAAVVCVDGYEADDAIATLAVRHHGEGVDVLTGDKDLLQLAAYEGVRILDVQGVPVDAEKKFGVPPGRIGDYLALVGDASDNVAGVRGCGPKSAVALIDAFGDIDAVLAGAPDSDAVPKRARAAVAACDADALRRDRRLVTLREDVPLPPLTFEPFAWDNVLDMADRFEFTTFRRRAEALMRAEEAS